MAEKRTKKPSAIGPGIVEKKNKAGEIVSYKFMLCVDRDAHNKQIWRTATISKDDPRLEGLTPAKLKRTLKNLKAAWDDEQREEYELTKTPKSLKEKTTLSDFVEFHWMSDHVLDGTHSPNSVSFYRATIKPSLEYFGNTRKLKTITAEDIKRFLKYLKTEARNDKGEPYSGTSQLHIYSTLRNCLNYAFRMGYLKEDPCKKITKREVPNRSKHSIDFLNPGEAKRFLACVDEEYEEAVRKYDAAEKAAKEEALNNGEDPDKIKNPEVGTLCRAAMWRAYWNLLISTGLRRGEAVGLQWGDIDPDKLTLKVSRSVCVDKNSEEKQIIKSTKSGDPRTVALLRPLFEILQEYHGIQESCYEGRILPSDFIFCSEASPARPLYVTVPTWHLKRFVKRHNLPDISPHDLRHTAASLAYAAGAGEKEIQVLLGHSDPSISKQFYIALTEETERRTVEGIGNYLFGK